MDGALRPCGLRGGVMTSDAWRDYLLEAMDEPRGWTEEQLALYRVADPRDAGLARLELRVRTLVNLWLDKDISYTAYKRLRRVAYIELAKDWESERWVRQGVVK